MMSNAKLAAARELIEEKKYVEARVLLLTIKDNPTAAKWLAQLETRINRAQPTQSTTQYPALERGASSVTQQETSPGPKPTPLPTNYTVLPRQQNLSPRYDPQLQQQYPAPVQQESEQVENIGMAGCFRTVWGLLTLLAIGWVIYGFVTTSSVVGNQLNTTEALNSQGFQAGTLIGGGLGITFFLCSGLPFVVLFGLLYWRNGVAIRETKKHNQVVEALRRR